MSFKRIILHVLVEVNRFNDVTITWGDKIGGLRRLGANILGEKRDGEITIGVKMENWKGLNKG